MLDWSRERSDAVHARSRPGARARRGTASGIRLILRGARTPTSASGTSTEPSGRGGSRGRRSPSGGYVMSRSACGHARGRARREADAEPPRLEVGRVRARRRLRVALLAAGTQTSQSYFSRPARRGRRGDVDDAVRNVELLQERPPRWRAGARARPRSPRGPVKTNCSTLSNWWTRNMPSRVLPGRAGLRAGSSSTSRRSGAAAPRGSRPCAGRRAPPLGGAGQVEVVFLRDRVDVGRRRSGRSPCRTSPARGRAPAAAPARSLCSDEPLRASRRKIASWSREPSPPIV